MKLRKKRKIFNWYIFFMIFFFTYLIIIYIGKNITPVVIKVIEVNVNKSLNRNIFYMFDKDILTNEKLMDMVSLQMNKNDEIVAIDYRYDIAYDYLREGFVKLFNDVRNLDLNIEYYDNEKNVFFVPLGVIKDNNVLLNEIGLKIPCKFYLINDLTIGLKTKVSNYGLNNLLVELFLIVDVENELLIPSNFHIFKNNFEYALASKVVIGKIPMYFGDSFEKSSTILSS